MTKKLTILRGIALLCCAIALAHASPSTAAEGPALGGVAACALVEGVPGPAHPLRKHPALKPLFASLDAAGQDRNKNARVLERIEKLLAPLYVEAEKAFARPPIKDGVAQPFKPQAARDFLEKWVFAANAPLRIGRDRIEPATGLASAMLLAACRADRRPAAIALGRVASGPEAQSQRAFAALLLLEGDRRDEALELLPELGDEGFLAPYVAAELATDATERTRLHDLARRHMQTPDHETAWREQAKRFEGRPQ